MFMKVYEFFLDGVKFNKVKALLKLENLKEYFFFMTLRWGSAFIIGLVFSLISGDLFEFAQIAFIIAFIGYIGFEAVAALMEFIEFNADGFEKYQFKKGICLKEFDEELRDLTDMSEW